MSAPSSDSEDGGSQQQDLLALLEAQCAGAMGIEPVSRAPPAASSSKRTLDEASSDEDDGGDSDGQWSGISEEDAAHEGQQTESEAAVIEFAEPSRRATGQGSKQDYKQFMSSNVAKMLNQKPQAPTTKGKRGRASKDDESSDEEDMKHLDATLQRLISTIPESEASQVEHSGFKKINHSIQDNTPLPLRLALQKTRLKRTKQQVAEAKEAGLLRPHAKGSREEPALTQHEKRLRDGSEARRKREARGIGGVVGQMVGGATTLRLSKSQIQAVNSGRGHELQQQQRRSDKHKSKKSKRK